MSNAWFYRKIFVPMLCLSLFCFALPCCVKSDELRILLNLKSALNKSTTPNVLDSWEPAANSVCSFNGITCNAQGSVEEIQLSNQNLAGVLPLDSICQLQSLNKLSFGFNSLYGAITEDLNSCVKLQYLDLGNNLFSGPFPHISSLSELRYLHLNSSGFSGTFPWNSLENMTGVAVLSLGDNLLDRSPFPHQILQLKNLTWLYLGNCSLEGKIPPGIGDLTELINLELQHNYLSGEIPVEIGKLHKLWQLELYENELTGKLPVGLRNLTNLENFDASINKLEGDLSEVGFLTNLITLQLFNNQFTGEVPPDLGEFRKLNKFTGEIPATYANCTSLLRFRVSNNSLSGIVPSGIWGLPKVAIIDVSFNQFEGPITSDIKNARQNSILLADQ
ncbi:hypothetical protein CCACVL1_16091 [Corchorus capsularis]|uniref:Leucine-rich repeat-containing N-terminal plant-type domain-containing protein n=1 Tax=Corchorus capsularis TaxID=210143 RepID=A0A1R3HZ99_COCAP|nr:hypothetical protein CCACVL1_16091 [Corchorus capsularis]